MAPTGRKSCARHHHGSNVARQSPHPTTCQFTHSNPGTRANSRTLRVTNMVWCCNSTMAGTTSSAGIGGHGFCTLCIAQGKVGKPPGQRQTVLRPFVRCMFANDFGHPAAFGQPARLGGLLNQRLGGIVQVNRDSWNGVTSVAVRTNYMPQRICTRRDSTPRLWPRAALRHNAPAPAGRCV